MKRFMTRTVGLLVLAILCCGAQTAHAQSDPDPQAIAQACIQQLASKAQHCVQRNAMRTGACVQIVNQLQDAGHPGKALFVGTECIQRTILRSQQCIHQINVTSAICSLILLELDAPGLAELVNEAGDAAAAAVAQSRQMSIQAILNALQD